MLVALLSDRSAARSARSDNASQKIAVTLLNFNSVLLPSFAFSAPSSFCRLITLHGPKTKTETVDYDNILLVGRGKMDVGFTLTHPYPSFFGENSKRWYCTRIMTRWVLVSPRTEPARPTSVFSRWRHEVVLPHFLRLLLFYSLGPPSLPTSEERGGMDAAEVGLPSGLPRSLYFRLVIGGGGSGACSSGKTPRSWRRRTRTRTTTPRVGKRGTEAAAAGGRAGAGGAVGHQKPSLSRFFAEILLDVVHRRPAFLYSPRRQRVSSAK